MMSKLRRWQLEDEEKRLKELVELYDRLRANHAMYLRCGDYDAADRFADKSITQDSMAKKIKQYGEKIKRQKNKIKDMKMEMERN